MAGIGLSREPRLRAAEQKVLGGELEEAREPRVEALTIGAIDHAPRQVKRLIVKALQNIEHRAVLVLE
jgi:hypothetical protein